MHCQSQCSVDIDPGGGSLIRSLEPEPGIGSDPIPPTVASMVDDRVPLQNFLIPVL